MAATTMNPLTEVANKYWTQLQTTASRVRKRSVHFGADAQRLVERLGTVQQEVEPRARQLQEEVSRAVRDMTPVDRSPNTHQFLLETYLWIAVCLVGLSSGQTVGRYVLRSLISSFFNTWVTLFLAYILIPTWFYLYNKKNRQLNDEDRRLGLFSFSVILGILVGQSLSHLHLSFYSPPNFILPLTIALASGFMGPKFATDRRILIGGTIGLATGIYFFLGLITHSMGISYTFWVLVSAAVSAVNLQIQLGRIQEGKADAFSIQFSALLTTIFVQTLLARIFGTCAKKVARQTRILDKRI